MKCKHIQFFFQNEIFKVDPWFLKVDEDISYKEIITILRNEQIPFIEYEDKFENFNLRFDGGVEMDFDDLSEETIFDKNWNPIKPEILKLDDQLLVGIRLFVYELIWNNRKE